MRFKTIYFIWNNKKPTSVPHMLLFLNTQALTVNDVRALMGSTLPNLKLFENDTIVQTWINRQLQSDLDTLGLGLVSSRVEVITPSPTSNGNVSLTSATSAKVTSTTQGKNNTLKEEFEMKWLTAKDNV